MYTETGDEATLVQKNGVIHANAHAVADGLLHFGLAYRKPGMLKCATKLVRIEQSIPASTSSNVVDFLPTPEAVRDASRRSANAERDFFRSFELQQVLEVGGGVTSDGRKQCTTAVKFYDFNLHYFTLSPRHSV